MTRTQIINDLINDNGYTSYLEIGVYDKVNFNAIRCPLKHGVDPDPKVRATYPVTSDQFFARNKKKYDIIFIDGLHHADQVIKDIDNALQALNPNGTIVVHDCNPTTEEMQTVPRMQGEWTGDVWKAWQHFRQREDLTMFVYDCDYGVGVIRRGQQEAGPTANSYEHLSTRRKEILNLIPYNPQPLSICIPAFEQYGHGARTLKTLLDSLKDQHGEFEVIVSDNDDLQHVCEGYNVRYYKNPNRGISANTNYAASLAKYNNIKIMYQDDIAYPGMVQAFSRALVHSPWVISAGYKIDEHGVKKQPTNPRWTDGIITGKNTIGMPSVTGFRKQDFAFDENLKTMLDCEFYWRLYKKYGLPWTIHAPVVGVRYWDGSTSRQQGNLSSQEMGYLVEKWPELSQMSNATT